MSFENALIEVVFASTEELSRICVSNLEQFVNPSNLGQVRLIILISALKCLNYDHWNYFNEQCIDIRIAKVYQYDAMFLSGFFLSVSNITVGEMSYLGGVLFF